MPRVRLTDEERAERRDARLERAREKRAEKAAEREQLKTVIRGEIAVLASVIPPMCGKAGCIRSVSGKTRWTRQRMRRRSTPPRSSDLNPCATR